MSWKSGLALAWAGVTLKAMWNPAATKAMFIEHAEENGAPPGAPGFRRAVRAAVGQYVGGRLLHAAVITAAVASLVAGALPATPFVMGALLAAMVVVGLGHRAAIGAAQADAEATAAREDAVPAPRAHSVEGQTLSLDQVQVRSFVEREQTRRQQEPHHRGR